MTNNLQINVKIHHMSHKLMGCCCCCPCLTYPCVSIDENGIKALGVSITHYGIKAPGVSINHDGIDALGVPIKRNSNIQYSSV